MELIRRNSDYALRGLVYMARFPLYKRFTIAALANTQGLPPPFLKKIFQKLAKARIVKSGRGPIGGFYLAREPSSITLREILKTVQGHVSLSDCLWAGNRCRRSRACSIRDGLRGIQGRLDNLLERYTLKDAMK